MKSDGFVPAFSQDSSGARGTGSAEMSSQPEPSEPGRRQSASSSDYGLNPLMDRTRMALRFRSLQSSRMVLVLKSHG
jgi:hypothetical protein